jgi:cell division protein YceG involved in septum cleavage
MKKLIRALIGLVILLVLMEVLGRYYARHHARPTYKFIPRAEQTIKIPEGWTNADIAAYLAKLGPWTSADFLRAAGSAQVKSVQVDKASPELTAASTATSTDWVQQFPFLVSRPKGASLEGYLFPDTYRVYASSTVAEIIAKMLTNFDAKLTPQLRADIKSQGKSLYDILIMASIIEKEAPVNYQTQDNHDAKIISGIFWRRLQAGQALQSDATLSYILQDNQTQHSGSTLSVDSPYNTYKYKGLPPGPICNPGLLSIMAAIYPTASAYNYFLTIPKQGTVVYAQTYADHLQNKYKYLK